MRSLGADRVIDYTREDFTQDNQRYDLVLDNAANRSLSEMRRVLVPNGKCVIAGAPKKTRPMLSRLFITLVYCAFSKKFGFFVASLNRDDPTALCRLIQDGKLTPAIDRRYPLAEGADAMVRARETHAIFTNFTSRVEAKKPSARPKDLLFGAMPRVLARHLASKITVSL